MSESPSHPGDGLYGSEEWPTVVSGVSEERSRSEEEELLLGPTNSKEVLGLSRLLKFIE